MSNPVLSSIILLNLMNILFVLWTAQVGRKLCFSVLNELTSLQPLSVQLQWTLRVLVVAAFVLVLAVYAYTVITVYLSSPLFMCEWGVPRFKGVVLRDSPEVRREPTSHTPARAHSHTHTHTHTHARSA